MAMSDWPAWLKQAEKLYDQKKYDDAVALACQVLQAVRDNGPANQVVGLVLSERRRSW